jgi:hypothetical protein
MLSMLLVTFSLLKIVYRLTAWLDWWMREYFPEEISRLRIIFSKVLGKIFHTVRFLSS